VFSSVCILYKQNFGENCEHKAAGLPLAMGIRTDLCGASLDLSPIDGILHPVCREVRHPRHEGHQCVEVILFLL
jgi:hypothetical protein